MGIGNLLMGDEGIGIHVIRYLQNDKELTDIEIVDGGTGGVQLLDYFFRHDLVILVDAAMDQREPGSITQLKPVYAKDCPRTIMVHDFGLKDILDALHLLDKKPEIILFSISISKVDKIGMSLSPKMRSVIPRAAEKIKSCLEAIIE